MTKLFDSLDRLAQEGSPRGHAEVMRGARASVVASAIPPTPGRRRHGRLLAFATAMAIGIAAVGAGVFVATGDSDPRVDIRATRPSSIPTTAATAETTAPTTTSEPVAPNPAAAGPFDSFRLGYEGLGPIKLGMTLEEASAASGAELVLVNGVNCDPVPNDSAMVVGHYRNEGEQLWFGVADSRIVSIATKNPLFSTISGIHVGSTRADVLRTYANAKDLPDYNGGEIRIADSAGREIIFYTPHQSEEAIGFIRVIASLEFIGTGTC
jgi:hypothetical protein